MKEKESKFKDLGPEDQKTLEWMKRNRRSNGDIGYSLQDGPEAVEWLRYYQRNYPHKVGYMLSRIREDKSYMVPARWPHFVDTTWAPKETKRTRIYPPKDAKNDLEVPPAAKV